ncbi:8-oxo-dGTP diphosphatase [Andreprevotia lacus DSM 23236]|jgi:8-oxo-dGTP diphosphatase|uniref:8-oxo-dGTP diphosphatase n=1 Tax=Andreprevotia lacus DSM 23236 TaxID=1121001 RepID=A0A1W1X747_9NEIS|nr:NUDIX domain-containing protein [Andreprevotia lacus]SMC19617.1 8-oxo-dGTP diphosphatase [Andreprevotia lacus DSM 23236]
MEPALIVTVDIVLFTLSDGQLKIVLLRRELDPYAQQLALPGGYIHPEEDRDSLAAAERVLRQKTGLVSPYLEQLFTFSGGVRDPRGWSASIAYYALVHESVLQPDAEHRFELLAVDGLPDLPFDHNRIVAHASQRLRDKSTYSSLPCHLLPGQFTLTELQHTYEQVLGISLDKSVFRRKLGELDFLEAIPNAMRSGKHRPAQLYKLRDDARLALFNKTV